MVKERKNKSIEEFDERRNMAENAKYQKLSAYGIARKLDNNSYSREDDSEERERKYTFGLASMDEKIHQGELREAYFTFLNLKQRLDNEKTMHQEKVEKYKEALAKRGFRLVNKSSKSNNYYEDNKVILEYCNKHLNKKSSGLEKAITVISLVSIVLGIAIGYPALTGNVVTENVGGSMSYGAALFFVGLLGVFLANKK